MLKRIMRYDLKGTPKEDLMKTLDVLKIMENEKPEATKRKKISIEKTANEYNLNGFKYTCFVSIYQRNHSILISAITKQLQKYL